MPDVEAFTTDIMDVVVVNVGVALHEFTAHDRAVTTRVGLGHDAGEADVVNFQMTQFKMRTEIIDFHAHAPFRPGSMNFDAVVDGGITIASENEVSGVGELNRVG